MSEHNEYQAERIAKAKELLNSDNGIQEGEILEVGEWISEDDTVMAVVHLKNKVPRLKQSNLIWFGVDFYRNCAEVKTNGVWKLNKSSMLRQPLTIDEDGLCAKCIHFQRTEQLRGTCGKGTEVNPWPISFGKDPQTCPAFESA